MNDSVRGGSGDGLPHHHRGAHRSAVPGQLQTIGGHTYPLQPVAINVSVSRVRDGDGDADADGVSFDAFGSDGKERHVVDDVESGKMSPE